MIKLPCRYIWQNPVLRPVMYPVRDAKLREFLLLYDEQDLVKQHASKLPAERMAVVNAALQANRQRYESMDHDALLAAILDRFDADPSRQRYPDWLRYIVVHFSGIRYKSAHGTWANPVLLLPKLENMVRETLKKVTLEQLAEMLQKANPQPSPADLEGQKNAVFSYQTAQNLAQPNLPPEGANLAALERLLLMKERMGFPGWFWKEVVSHTDLRLAVQKGDWLNDWENLSLEDIRERQASKDFRWQTILFEWKQDITAWRLKHYSDLTLVVTRAVCNEVSEHIHHLRGIKPASGLTGKPIWYRNLAGGGPPVQPAAPKKTGMEKEKDSIKKDTAQPPAPPVTDLLEDAPYFGRALNRSYFKPGASILSLGWTSMKPNPWQIASPIGGVDFQEKVDPAWKYAIIGSEIVRTKPAPLPLGGGPPGMPQPKHKDEKAGPHGKSKTPDLKEWLRWTHEAIVVGVFDLLNGPNVITFETFPKTGINRTHILNKQNRWSEFIGYNPGAAFDPVKDSLKIRDFQEMLQRGNLLPAVAPAGDELSFDISPVPSEAPPLDIQGEAASAARDISAVWESLTSRQREVVALICQGYSNRDAATRLDTTLRTIQTHMKAAQEKFGVDSSEAVQALLANWDFGDLEEDSSE